MRLDWSLLGGNPAPGDVGALEAASANAKRLQQDAADYRSEVQSILSGWGTAGWTGQAASKFGLLLQGVAQHLLHMEEAHEGVGQALTKHADVLALQQPIAERALQQAEQAQAKRSTAADRRTTAQSQYAEATRSYCQATTQLSQIERDIASRLEQLGMDIFAAVASVADPELQSLQRAKQELAEARSMASRAMEAASGIVREMESLIIDMETVFRSTIKLAEQVRSEVEDSANRVVEMISGAETYLQDFWHHLDQDVSKEHPSSIFHYVETGLLVGMGLRVANSGRSGDPGPLRATELAHRTPSHGSAGLHPGLATNLASKSSPQYGTSAAAAAAAWREYQDARNDPSGDKKYEGTKWGGSGECIVAVQRWLEEGGIAEAAKIGAPPTSGPITALINGGGVRIPVQDARAGDVVQLGPNNWTGNIHTYMIVGVPSASNGEQYTWIERNYNGHGLIRMVSGPNLPNEVNGIEEPMTIFHF